MADGARFPTLKRLNALFGGVEGRWLQSGRGRKPEAEGRIPMIPENQAFKPVFSSVLRTVSAFISAPKRPLAPIDFSRTLRPEFISIDLQTR